MGEYKRKPTLAASQSPVGEASGPAAGPTRSNAAAQEALFRQGEKLAPSVKDGITKANVARFATGQGLKLVDKAAAAATGTERLLGDTDAGKALGGAGKALGTGLGAVGHFAGDRVISEDLWGHAAASATKGVTDTLITGAAGGSPLAALPAIIDAMVPQDSAWKPATSTAAAIEPTGQIKKGVGAFVDAGTFLSEADETSLSEKFRAADAMEANALDGSYGPVARGLTGLTGQAMGDTEIIERFTGKGAEQGDEGIMTAFGNFLADTGWEAGEALEEGYDRSQQGIHNAAGILLQGQSAEELERSRIANEQLADRFIR